MFYSVSKCLMKSSVTLKVLMINQKYLTNLAITCLELTIETLEQGVKHIQS